MNKRKKVSIIGAGQTGATLAFILAKNESVRYSRKRTYF